MSAPFGTWPRRVFAKLECNSRNSIVSLACASGDSERVADDAAWPSAGAGELGSDSVAVAAAVFAFDEGVGSHVTVRGSVWLAYAIRGRFSFTKDLEEGGRKERVGTRA